MHLPVLILFFFYGVVLPGGSRWEGIMYWGAVHTHIYIIIRYPWVCMNSLDVESPEIFYFINEDGHRTDQIYIDPDGRVCEALLHFLWCARGVFLPGRGFGIRQRPGIVTGLIKV